MEHDRGRGVTARCLRAVSRGGNPDGSLQSDLQSEMWNGNEDGDGSGGQMEMKPVGLEQIEVGFEGSADQRMQK